MPFAFLALLLPLFTAPASAALFKCEDADGHVTFTDGACPPGSRSRSALGEDGLRGDGGEAGAASRREARAERARLLAQMTDEARRLCAAQMADFLRQRRPDLPEALDIRIGRALSQFLSRGNGRFLFQGLAHYREGGKNKETEVRCSAVKLGDMPWSLTFEERQTRVYVAPPAADSGQAGTATPSPPGATDADH